jgi:hypothetical protein
MVRLDAGRVLHGTDNIIRTCCSTGAGEESLDTEQKNSLCTKLEFLF